MVNIYQKRGWWYLCWSEGGKRRRRSLKTKDEAEAALALQEAEKRLSSYTTLLDAFRRIPPKNLAPTPNGGKNWHLKVDKIANYLYRNSFRNAKTKGISFLLSKEDVKLLLFESNGYCAISGIDFDLSLTKNGRRPYYPSIDRIDSNDHYSIDNCRIVCIAVNYALHVFGEEVFKHIVTYTYIRFKYAGVLL